MSEQMDRQAALDELFNDAPEKKAREKELAKLEKKRKKAEKKAAKKKTDMDIDMDTAAKMDEGAEAEREDTTAGLTGAESTEEESAESEGSREASSIVETETASDANYDNLADEQEAEPDKKTARKQKREERKKRKQEKEVNIIKDLISLCFYLLCVIALCWGILTYVGQRTEVSGESMNDTLNSGDSLWIDKWTYHFHDPERYDIVVFPYGDDGETYYIKRIIGLPGETVYIDEDGVIYIDDEPLTTDVYGKDVIDATKRGIAAEPVLLGEDEYFVLGDNRNNSRDSRVSDVGKIHRDEFIGKAVFRFTGGFEKIE